MLLHLNFFIEWFDSNSKEKFKIQLKICLENLENKIKRKLSLFFCFRPALGLARLPPRCWPRRSPLFSPPSLSWAEPSRWPGSRLRLRRPSLADAASPQVRDAFLLKPSATTISKITGGRIRLLILFFLFWSGSRAI
jgi:hypothetical protein